MLKNSHQKKAVREQNVASKFILTDEHVVLYILAFFKVSPRYDNGAAPANEWLQFLELYNEREGHFILTDLQMEAIRPYCEINAEVEMTPEDFIRLIYLIRHGHMQPTFEETEEITPQMSVSTKQLFDSRPRSSKLISKNYYQRSKSPSHPIMDDDFSISSRKSGYSNDDFSNHHNTIYTEFDSGNLVETLKRDKLVATKQIRDYESRIQSLVSEHSLRITQLQSKWENISMESGHLKSMISVQKNKERERLDKISELQGIIADSDIKLSSALKKLQAKDQQIDMYKERLIKLEELLNFTNQNLSETAHLLSQEQDIVRVLQLEKTRNQQVLEEERKLVVGLKKKLQDQYQDNKGLLDVIAKQRLDDDVNCSTEVTDKPHFGLNDCMFISSMIESNPNPEPNVTQERVQAKGSDDQEQVKARLAELQRLVVVLQEEKEQNEQAIEEYHELQARQTEMIKNLAARLDTQPQPMTESEPNLAQERTEAGQVKDNDQAKITALQRQVVELQEEKHQNEQVIHEYLALQGGQTEMINNLTTGFGKQHQSMTEIERTITKSKMYQNRLSRFISTFAKFFLLYHVFAVTVNIVFYGPKNNTHINPLFSVFNYVEDWYTI